MRVAWSGRRLHGTIAAGVELLATLAIVALVAGVLVVGRPGSQPAAGDASPGLAILGEPSAQTLAPSVSADPTAWLPADTSAPSDATTASPASAASPSVDPGTPVPDATPVPTRNATPQPTLAATPRPTPSPTRRPSPTPRPTPVIHRFTTSGSFGTTLLVKGIAVRLAPTAADQSLLRLCSSADPEMQGWTELRAYRLTITWPDPKDAEEPMVEVGAHPFNMMSFDPAVRSGVTTTVTLCHRPGDTERVVVGLTGPAGPDEILVEYFWYFS